MIQIQKINLRHQIKVQLRHCGFKCQTAINLLSILFLFNILGIVCRQLTPAAKQVFNCMEPLRAFESEEFIYLIHKFSEYDKLPFAFSFFFSRHFLLDTGLQAQAWPCLTYQSGSRSQTHHLPFWIDLDLQEQLVHSLWPPQLPLVGLLVWLPVPNTRKYNHTPLNLSQLQNKPHAHILLHYLIINFTYIKMISSIYFLKHRPFEPESISFHLCLCKYRRSQKKIK